MTSTSVILFVTERVKGKTRKLADPEITTIAPEHWKRIWHPKSLCNKDRNLAS